MRPVKILGESAVKRHIGSLTTVLVFGASILGIGTMVRAQQPPPDSQQPMEIPARIRHSILRNSIPKHIRNRIHNSIPNRIRHSLDHHSSLGRNSKAKPTWVRRASAISTATSRLNTAIPANGMPRR